MVGPTRLWSGSLFDLQPNKSLLYKVFCSSLKFVKRKSPYKVAKKFSTIQKSRIRETLNPSTCADTSTDTKTDKNKQKGREKMSCVMCHVSHVACHM